MKALYAAIAARIEARENCKRLNNPEWAAKHGYAVVKLTEDYLPSGSGFDAGASLDFDASTPEKLVFVTSFHHMTDGTYDRWTRHTVTVRPSLAHGLRLTVSGPNRNDIRDYISDVFHAALSQPVAE